MNLSEQEKKFLYLKHRKEGNNELISKNKVNLVNKEIKITKEMEKFNEAKFKSIILNKKK